MNRKAIAAAIAAVGALVLVVGLAAFQPWKLWVDDKASDADLVVATAPASPGGDPNAAQQQQGAQKLFEDSRWRSYSHGETTGTVKVYKQPDGSNVVRLEDLKTSNGPDVKVVLSEKPYDQVGSLGSDYLTLDTLKGNSGSSNYAVPPGTDLSKYRSAVIWCKRFDAVFAAVAIV